MENLNCDLLPFTKMHGIGNDFILIDAEDLLVRADGQNLINAWATLVPRLARQLCHRRFSIGADGLVLALNLQNPILQSFAQMVYGPQLHDCDLSWIFTNSDGSNAEMCVNALRCLALWAEKRSLIPSQFTVGTAAGAIKVDFASADKITVDLGQPRLLNADIPFLGTNGNQRIVKEDLVLPQHHFPITCVNVGNPHCVIFSGPFMQISRPQLPLSREAREDYFPTELAKIAREIQTDKRFPQSTNVEFVYVQAPNRADVLVFERGAGATLACGSGACAALIAGVLEERLMRDSTIILPGGSLDVSWSIDDNHVRLTGPARVSFNGEFALPEVKI